MRPLLLVLAAAALTVLAAGCSMIPGMSMGSNAPIDQQFVDMMVPHHQGAVGMARVALVKSQRPEIRTMANDIIASQDKEIAQMLGWRQAWFGSATTPPMSAMPMISGMPMSGMDHGGGSTMNLQSDIDKLTASTQFDRDFIDLMIPHHQDAIEASKYVQPRTQRPEIKQLTGEIIIAQEREIAQMRQWRQAWFPG